MKNFITEKKIRNSNNSENYLRLLYTPLIGADAVCLYSLLCDFHQMHGRERVFESFKSLSSFVNAPLSDVEIMLKKLGAIGLIRVFEHSNQNSHIISINEPLSPALIRKNAFLYRQLVSKIGEVAFEKVDFAFKDRQLAKDEYSEITTKYQDFFETTKPLVSVESTLEIPLNSVKSKDEAISSLSPAQFVFFLTNKKVSPSQLECINRILQFGFSSVSINFIISYVFEVNNKFVNAHVEAIAKDLITKDLKGAVDVEIELTKALLSRRSKSEVSLDENLTVENNDGNNSETWDDIFKSLGGEL